MLMFVMTHTQFCCLVWSFYSWSTICTWQCYHSVGFLTLKFSVWILSIDVWFFIIRKLFDISCVSHHVQPISKLPSVALAECGHFVVTWSVQCGHLVCAGIFLHSPALLCGHIGLNKTKYRKRLEISTLNSPLTVQFNVPKK